MLIKRNKIFSGYSESISNGTEYINSQLKQGGEYLGDKLENLGNNTSEYVLNPIADGLETIENLPIVKDVKPRSIPRYKRLFRSVAVLMNNKQSKNKSEKKIGKKQKSK